MSNQYVIFDLENQKYAISVNLVIEVTELKESTKVPGTSGYVNGIINLRGKVISVIDLKDRLGIKSRNKNTSNQILVVENNKKQIGLIVDIARDIKTIESCDIKEASLLNCIDSRYIESIINLENEIIVALNFKEIV